VSERGDRLLHVQARITDRDLTLLGWLADHGVLTTGQIAHALYPSLDFAQRRLLKLVEYGLLDRFRPQRPDGGSHPYHYVLAQLGVEVVAAQRGEADLPRRDQARRRRWWLTNRANLPHLLAVNQFFTDLAGHARTHPGTALERWWPSARCRAPGAFAHLDGHHDPAAWNATIAADGHGVWADTTHPGGPARVAFFVEVDLGTEDLPRLVGKLDAYTRWQTITGRTWPVLYWLTSPTRERHLHQRLATQPAPVILLATAVAGRALPTGDAGPASRVWWPSGPIHYGTPTADTSRCTLTDLTPASCPTTPERR
jgi:Replication-relaxation